MLSLQRWSGNAVIVTALVHTLPKHIYVQTNWKVNFASDDPFNVFEIKSLTLTKDAFIWSKMQ